MSGNIASQINILYPRDRFMVVVPVASRSPLCTSRNQPSLPSIHPSRRLLSSYELESFRLFVIPTRDGYTHSTRIVATTYLEVCFGGLSHRACWSVALLALFSVPCHVASHSVLGHARCRSMHWHFRYLVFQMVNQEDMSQQALPRILSEQPASCQPCRVGE